MLEVSLLSIRFTFFQSSGASVLGRVTLLSLTPRAPVGLLLPAGLVYQSYSDWFRKGHVTHSQRGDCTSNICWNNWEKADTEEGGGQRTSV